MVAVLVASAGIHCASQGQATIPTSQSVLKVNGTPVLLKTDLPHAPITGCQLMPTKCTMIDQVTAGISTVLKVNGTPVMLATVAGVTDQKEALLLISAGQSVLDSK